MRVNRLFILIAMVVLADQVLKFYIKTNFHLHSSVKVMGDWFQLYFVENPGMAYGWKFGGGWGKIALTVFRMGAVLFGSWYLLRIIRLGYNKWFIVCAGLIYAGALGNLIDSTLYGVIFDKGMVFEPSTGEYLTYGGLATLSSDGYSSFLHGNVVDMFYFPIIRGQFPEWMPFWGGEDFEFFRPIFNLADASISVGVMCIIFFQKSMFKQQNNADEAPIAGNGN